MKIERMNISHSHFILFNLKISDETVTTFYLTVIFSRSVFGRPAY